jgi:hypothetical protein
LELLEGAVVKDETTGEIEATLISCEPDVKAALNEFSREIEPELKPGGSLRDKSGYLSGFGGKAPGLAVRVAGVLALTDEHSLVSLDDFQHGKRFAEYGIGHARIVAGFVSEDPATAEAKRVLAWIERKGERVIKRRDVYRDLNLNVRDAAAALGLLEEHEFVRPVESPPTFGPGRKATAGAQAYHVNPHVLGGL